MGAAELGKVFRTTFFEKIQVVWVLGGSLGYFALYLLVPLSVVLLVVSFANPPWTSAFATVYAATVVSFLAWLTLLFVPE